MAKNDAYRFEVLLASVQHGNVYFVTGKNGTGKSRFFSYATREYFQKQIDKGEDINKIICMSGTMHDKYPPEIYKKSISNEAVIYLGNKVNNNMVSDTAPFRMLCKYILINIFDRSQVPVSSSELILNALQRLNFESSVIFKFRYGKNRKAEVFSSVSSELKVNLIDDANSSDLIGKYLQHLKAGDILLSDVSFFRNDVAYGLAELSSGEKQYVLALLGLIYCGCPSCILFYDEPENSLHPSWQLSIVNDLSIIAEKLFPNSILIVATHSPLIASSVRNERTYICDFPSGQSWQRSSLHGQASDTVLREQFHLYSARSPDVYIIVNKCLDFIAKNESHTPEFLRYQNELREYDLSLQSDDPLSEVVTTILGF